jgi:hypothetical protein
VERPVKPQVNPQANPQVNPPAALRVTLTS